VPVRKRAHDGDVPQIQHRLDRDGKPTDCRAAAEEAFTIIVDHRGHL